jgi:hypothetical protein
MVHLPALTPGQYELIAEATDREGEAGALAPLLVSITE